MKNREHSAQEEPGSKAALWAGIVFSLVFTAAIHLCESLLPEIRFAPDTGASHYYWKLPDPSWVTRAVVWSSYFAHQIMMWGLIWRAQRSGLAYTQGLHRINLIALVGNACFVLWHLAQTMVWYDGLAQDVSIWSSQWSVIIMLVLILHLENQRRGVFFGKKIAFLTQTGVFVRKYHGFVFSWAIVYTFWFHPMENTPGHLMGFFYTFMLMLQGSLFFTRIHRHPRWTIVLEVLVLFHGTLVAINQGKGMWPMFFFGFGGLFIITQMHGLGLQLWQRWAFLLAYLGAALLVYAPENLAHSHQVTWIPVTEYAAMFVLAGLIWIGMRITARKKG